MKDPALYWSFPFYRHPQVYSVIDRRELRCAVCFCIPKTQHVVLTNKRRTPFYTCGSAYCARRVERSRA